MKGFLIAWLGAVAAVLAAEPLSPPTIVVRGTNSASAGGGTNDPVEVEYQKLLELDDDAQAEADKWIRENEVFAAKGAGVSQADLSRRIRARFEPVGSAYESFLAAHPTHVKARIAYGGFLNDLKDEDGAQTQWEKALELDKSNPAVYNNLANQYGHTGPVKKAFEYYAKAIELSPNEPIYYHNLGTTVYLFRTDAQEYYHVSEQEVFNKALVLYSNAMRLDPTNFPLASDVAQTYYGIRPTRTEDALRAWTNALSIANDEIEREGVYLHFARIKLNAGRFAEAHSHLDDVTLPMYVNLKARLARNLDEREHPGKTNVTLSATATNSAAKPPPDPASLVKPPVPPK